MNISVISDLHCRNKSFPPSFKTEEIEPADVLVVAGDLSVATTFYKMATKLSDEVSGKFKKAIFVKGNHDYYITDSHWIKHHAIPLGPSTKDNFVETVTLGNGADAGSETVDFICSPMWSPIFDHNTIRTSLNDYNYIPGFTTEKCTALFWENVEWLEDACAKSREHGNKYVIVTHHLPFRPLIDSRYEGSYVNEAFCVMDGDAEARLKALAPVLWIHGHSHNFMDATVDGIRCVRNPYGYEWTSHDYGAPGTSKESTGYVKNFIVEI